MEKTVDKQLALLDYRKTPLEEVYFFPCQLLMAGRQRNTLPVAVNILRPESQNLESIKQSLQFVKGVQKASFDNKCKSKELMPLYLTDPITL